MSKDKRADGFDLSNLGEVISKGVQAGVRGMNAGFLGMRQGDSEAERDTQRETGETEDFQESTSEYSDSDASSDRKHSSKALRWFGIEREGGIHLNLDLGKIVIGSISLALGIASFFLYLIPFVLVLSWPIAAAGFFCGLVPIFSFGQAGWFRGFTFGIIGAALSGGTLFFHIYDLTTAQTSLDYLLGFWGV